MSDALDLLCRAGGAEGAVLINTRRVLVCTAPNKIIDVEHHEGRHDRGQAIRTLAGRLTPQRRRG